MALEKVLCFIRVYRIRKTQLDSVIVLSITDENYSNFINTIVILDN